MPGPMRRLLSDFLSLLFPRLCAACQQSLHHGEQVICLGCAYDLPYTDFHTYADNPVARAFWGRIPVQSAMALLYFQRGNRTQQLLHQLKYQRQPEIGRFLGAKLGERLAGAITAAAAGIPIDLIIPVPLHPRRQRSRGYNQSEHIARGIATILQVPVHTGVLKRQTHTSSQTRKDRSARVDNMAAAFLVLQPALLQNKHILLVDDVITTGATLEACALALQQSLPVGSAPRISIATLAYSR